MAETNFPFYTFLIRLKIAELAKASFSLLQLVIASLLVLVEYTNFPFYIYSIQLEIDKLAVAIYG